MHDLVFCLKVCCVVSLETYIIDIMYMITHVDSALEIQQKAHHSCISIQSLCHRSKSIIFVPPSMFTTMGHLVTICSRMHGY